MAGLVLIQWPYDPLLKSMFQRKSALKRTGFNRKSAVARKPLNRRGPRTREWSKVWAWLKPRVEAAGRVQCEFGFIPHECWGPLTPAHSRKRREMVGDDIYAVAICCLNFHRHLDEELSHDDMYAVVMKAINLAGGLVLPEGK